MKSKSNIKSVKKSPNKSSKKSHNRKSPNRKSPNRKSPNRKSPKRRSPKRRSPKMSQKLKISKMYETEKFIELCNTHIMVHNLEHVIQTTHLQKNDCNIFFIGEEHLKREYENAEMCEGILDTLKDLTKDTTNNKINIDFFIEISNKYVFDSEIYNFTNSKTQMTDVINEFINCIKTKKCPFISVHWSDPTYISEKDKRYKKIPNWLKLYQLYSENDFDWKDLTSITKYFNPYKNENTIIKLLIDNHIVMKEIDKASKVNPLFNIKKIKYIFLNMYKKIKKYYKNDMKLVIFTMDRTVMDFYTISRIIKSEMKNVLFYGGDNHVERIKHILIKYFDFYQVDTYEGHCHKK